MKKLIIIFLCTYIFYSLNAQTEKQDTIKFDAITKEFIDPIYGTPTPKQKEPLESGIENISLKVSSILLYLANDMINLSI